jgi:dTDP-4-dehydrorhamnose 3,5-epimerase
MKTEIESNQIPGVIIKALKTHKDDRGFFREVIRFNDPFFEEASNFGQWSHSRMVKNVVKAWHYHHVQTDWWYVGIGLCEVVLVDHREESPTFKKKIVFMMGENPDSNINSNLCVKIPPGVLHACKVLSSEAHLFYVTSQTYNQNDEGRFAFDAGPVPHNWGADALVADNDKRDFMPTADRVKFI